MYEEIKNTMRRNLSSVYLYLCLWGNKRRFEEEKLRRKIQDENDILKEEFDQRNFSDELLKYRLILYRIKQNKKPLGFNSEVNFKIEII